MSIFQKKIITYNDVSPALAAPIDYLKGRSLIPIDELESPIGLRVEEGGYIFYDDTVGFQGGEVKPSNKRGSDIPANALASYWGVSATYHDYAYDVLRGCVVRTSTSGTCRRFMVVGENDMAYERVGNMLLWDISSNTATFRSTYTDFGSGEFNTRDLCFLISDKTTIWWTARFYRQMSMRNDWLKNKFDNYILSLWFVPSRDELCVLLFMMQHYDTYRPTQGIYSKQLQIPFYSQYWSSSQDADNVRYAWCGYTDWGSVDRYDKEHAYKAVRLCRYF